MSSDIKHVGRTVRCLFEQGIFPDKGMTLLEERYAYAIPSTGMRDDVHKDAGRGEWFVDFVDTNGAKDGVNGTRIVKYVQRPEDIAFGLRSGGCVIVGGKVMEYSCPPSGWAVPADGLLWHPETGAAIATVNDRKTAVSEFAKYIETYPNEFVGWKIPERWHDEFRKLFGENFDSERPTPEQLAELETSYQNSPDPNTGVRAIRRYSYREQGPFYIHLNNDFCYRTDDLGVRIRNE